MNKNSFGSIYTHTQRKAVNKWQSIALDCLDFLSFVSFQFDFGVLCFSFLFVVQREILFAFECVREGNRIHRVTKRDVLAKQ